MSQLSYANTVICQPSHANRQTTAVIFQQTQANRQEPTVICQPSYANRHDANHHIPTVIMAGMSSHQPSRHSRVIQRVVCGVHLPMRISVLPVPERGPGVLAGRAGDRGAVDHGRLRGLGSLPPFVYASR